MTPTRLYEKSIFVYKMDFQTVRMYGSIAIILGCFIFLYPKLLHPLIMTLFGGTGDKTGNEMDDFVPPPMRNRNPDARSDIPENIRRSMRHGPHPGMRAAAAEQSKQTKGSGRGMMGVILPMYAVGIVVYLVYTLCKVFNKKEEKRRDRGSPTLQQPRESHGSDEQYSEEEADLDMRKLQERLAETEAQMSKILAAMKSVQGKVGDVTSETIRQAEQDLASMGNNEDNQETLEKQETPSPVNDSSAESTPDSESYEIINKSNGDSNGKDGSPEKPETVRSKTSDDMDKNEAETVGPEESDEETQHTEETDEDGDDTEDEVEEVLMQEKQDKEEQENVTVRKRIPKMEDTES